jgi:hypothetical protein
MIKEPKWLKTDVLSTKSGKELLVRATPVYDEVGILDEGQDVAIYWKIEDLEKIIEKLKEVVSGEL